MKTNRGSRGQGFTLIELLVVVGIIGIMVAVAIPAIANYLKGYRIRGAAQQVAGELTRARGKAIGTNTNNGVLLVAGIGGSDQQYQYWVEDDPTNTPGLPTRPAIPMGLATGPPNGSVMRLPMGIHFVATAGAGWAGRAIRFDRLGRACAPVVNCLGSDGAKVVNDPNNATPPATPYINTAPSAAYNGDYTICLRQDATPLTMAVVVEPGGITRVVQPPVTQPCP
jgi:prepilin-type N-terminal cleavage/methylation domain-containing protein